MHVHTTCPPHEVNANTQQTNMDHRPHIHLLCGMRSHTTTCKVKRGSSAQHTLPVLYLVLCSTEHTPQSTMQTAVHSRQTITKYYRTHYKHMHGLALDVRVDATRASHGSLCECQQCRAEANIVMLSIRDLVGKSLIL